MPHIGQAGKYFTLSAITSLLLLGGCGSTPKQTKAPSVVTPKPAVQKVEEILTPEHKLLEAKKYGLNLAIKTKETFYYFKLPNFT